MIPFRHCIREPHGSAVKFEILAAAPNEFQVRYPDYDYIKMGVGPSVMYNREQLLCFLLTYDKAEYAIAFIQHRPYGLAHFLIFFF